MSNLVMNDDSVICPDCFEDSYGSGLRIEREDDIIIGRTSHIPCRVCGYLQGAAS